MILLLALFMSSAHAADSSFGFGSRIGTDSSKFTSQFNYRDSVWDNTYYQMKVGYFDGAHAGLGGGARFDFRPVEIRGGLAGGPTVGQAWLELNSELYMGVRDRRGYSIGFQWDRFTRSNRDYITLQLTQEF
jgi:hypothetical protein